MCAGTRLVQATLFNDLKKHAYVAWSVESYSYKYVTNCKCMC